MKASIEQSRRTYVPKGLNLAVLQAIRVLGIRASGTEIRDYLERLTGQEMQAAKVYVALSRLEANGFVTCRVDHETTAGRRGRPRNIYQLGASGLRALQAGMNLYANPDASRLVAGQHEEEDAGQPAPEVG